MKAANGPEDHATSIPCGRRRGGPLIGRYLVRAEAHCCSSYIAEYRGTFSQLPGWLTGERAGSKTPTNGDARSGLGHARGSVQEGGKEVARRDT